MYDDRLRLSMICLLENFRRIDREAGFRLFREEFADITKNLSVKLEKLDIDDRGWIHVDFSGIDSEILTEIAKRKYGIAPTDITKLERGDIIRGIIVDSTVGYGIYIVDGLVRRVGGKSKINSAS